METVEFLLRKGLKRAACSRSSVAALAMLPVQGDWIPIALGWNHPVLERGGTDCADCPRAKASDVVPGVSSYDSGPSSCIALHAEEHALRGVRGYDKWGSVYDWGDVLLLTTREPCYRCESMLRTLGVAWQVVDLDKDEKVAMPSPR